MARNASVISAVKANKRVNVIQMKSKHTAKEILVDRVMSVAHPTTMTNSKLVEESALNQAQLLLERCVESSGVSRRELQRRAGMSVDIPHILCNNFTVKTMAKLLFACGYEVRFSISKIETKAAETADKKGVGE
jgi:hypothetical protein